MLEDVFSCDQWELIMVTEENKIQNTEKHNVEDSRPSKRSIPLTIFFALLLAFAFIALGMWFTY